MGILAVVPSFKVQYRFQPLQMTLILSDDPKEKSFEVLNIAALEIKFTINEGKTKYTELSPYVVVVGAPLVANDAPLAAGNSFFLNISSFL